MGYTFTHNEPVVSIDDAQREDVTVELSRDTDWLPVVKLTCRASATFAAAAAYLDPDGARALASALETFATLADLNRDEEADPEPITPAPQPAEGDMRITPGGVAFIFVNGLWRQTVISDPVGVAIGPKADQ